MIISIYCLKKDRHIRGERDRKNVNNCYKARTYIPNSLINEVLYIQFEDKIIYTILRCI